MATSESAPSATAANARRSVGDWIRAGYDIMAEEGLKAMTIDRLCRRLGVTKGSFYWHFTDMKAYRAALVESWAALRDEDRRQLDSLAALPPRQRLSLMMTALVSPRHWTLERAMREWARSDATVATAIRASDRRVVAAVRQAFLDDGFDPDEADIRADAIFAAGVGFLHLAGSTPGRRVSARRERFLEVMLRH
jgi:AcrR family transcriptional regulator